MAGLISSAVQTAVNQAQLIQKLIDELDDTTKANAPEFFASIHSGAGSLCATIEKTGRVTTKQENALNNWERGVRRWIHEDKDR